MTLPAEEKDVSSTLIDTEVKACEEVVEADCPTVLVIDDNADIRNYVKSLLSNEFRDWMLRTGQRASGWP